MGIVCTKTDWAIIIALAPFACIILGPYYGVKLAARKSRDIITGKKPDQIPSLLPRRPLTPPFHVDPGWDQRQGQVPDQDNRESKRQHKKKRTTKDLDTATPTLQMCTQSQSILFRAPPEVRELIYREILSFPIPLQVVARVGGLHTNRKPGRHQQDYSWSVFGLLACCRRVYSESIHVLYETNLLDFPAHDIFPSLVHFPKYIIPSRLQTFQFIQFDIHLDPGAVYRSQVTFRRCCDVLRMMTSLRSLVIVFMCQKESVNLVPFLEMMAGIRACRFDVFLRRGLLIPGGPNPEVFPDGIPFRLLKRVSEFGWEPWAWLISLES